MEVNPLNARTRVYMYEELTSYIRPIRSNGHVLKIISEQITCYTTLKQLLYIKEDGTY